MKKVGGMGSGLSGLTGLSGLSIGGAWTPASPDEDGNLPHTGYAPWLLTGIYQDSAGTTPAASDGDPVGNMTNVQMFGTDAYTVVQATSANKPTLRTGANGLDGQAVIETDGNDYLQGAFNGGLISQPITIIAVAKIDSVVGASRVLYDGDDATNRILLYNDPTGPRWVINQGSNVNVVISDTNWKIFMHLANGASTNFYINGGADLVAANPGAQGLDGLTIFQSRAINSPWDGKIAALFIIDALASSAVLNQYGTYLQSIFSSLSYTEI